MDKHKIMIAIVKQVGKKSKNEKPKSIQPPVTVSRKFSEGYPTAGQGGCK